MAQNLLSVENVSKYYGIKKALDSVSLTIYQKEVVSLLGANGAGKTTLSSLIATRYPVSSGDIIFQGTSIYQDIVRYRCFIGCCPQQGNLNPDLTLQDNLLFAGRYYGLSGKLLIDRLDEVVEQFGLREYLREFPKVLSGGYKQRFLIARSIMHKPKLVILDEPTVALDPHVRHQVWEHIRDMRDRGMSVLLTTHYLDEAEMLSDRVCVLDHGKIRHIDTPKNLMSTFNKSRLEDVFLELMHDTQE